MRASMENGEGERGNVGEGRGTCRRDTAVVPMDAVGCRWVPLLASVLGPAGWGIARKCYRRKLDLHSRIRIFVNRRGNE